jgi:hypothetical protein
MTNLMERQHPGLDQANLPLLAWSAHLQVSPRAIKKRLLIAASAQAKYAPKQYSMCPLIDRVCKLAFETDKSVLKHRRASLAFNPAARCEALGHRRLAAEKVGQRFMVRGERVDTEEARGFKGRKTGIRPVDTG